jgi:hypothetical protein
MKLFITILISLYITICIIGCKNDNESEAQKFIIDYTKTYQNLYFNSVEAQWLANTNIKEENTQKEIEAQKKYIEFIGKKEINYVSFF